MSVNQARDNVAQFPLQQITAATYSVLAQSMGFPRYNPDLLVGRKGYQIFDQMMVDEQLLAAMNFKRSALLAREWSFIYDDDSQLSKDDQAERINVMESLVCELRGSFEDALTYVLRSMRHGFSITEMVFDLVEVDGKSYYACTELMPKPPESFYFLTDQYGVLRDFGQLVLGDRISLDINKFIHYVANPDYDQWYGRSELRAAYRSWYSKDVLVKLQNMWAERMAGGLFWVETSSDAVALVANSPEYNALMAALRDFKTINSLVLPKGYKGNFESPPATAAWGDIIEYHDLGMAKALLVPNLLGLSHTGKTGAYAQSQTQLEAFLWTLGAESRRLETALNQQLFGPLCELNFGDGDYPVFAFSEVSSDYLKWLVAQWGSLVAQNVVIATVEDETHLRKLMKMPTRTDDAQPLATEKTELGLAPDPMAPPGGAGGDGSPVAQPAKPDKVQTPNENKSSYRAHTTDGKPRKASVSAFTKASQRVNFSVIEHRGEALAASGAAALSPLVAQATAKAIGDDATVLARALSDIPKTAVFTDADVRRMKRAVKDALSRGWDLGSTQAQAELGRSRKTQTSKARFADLRDQASEYFEANGFRMAGNLSGATQAIIQQELINGVKNGKSPAQIRETIYTRLINKGYTTLADSLDQVSDDDVRQALSEAFSGRPEGNTTAYLDTLVRTNVFEAMNEARYAEFTDPALQGFVMALEYSAILDDRTTEICSALDGSVYKDDNPVWDTFRPPNHYNCRSVLIPITIDDGWDGQESPDPTVQPQDGFK